ncbi:isopenicillin N synthase family dioxygenase [Acetobacter musti]|nr:isopenicillin N synthase family oxygenase [Acetobacter musti]
MSAGPIPVLDIAAALSGDPDALEETAAALRTASEETGFVFMRGHGIPAEQISDGFAAAEAFHALPDAVKNRWPVNDAMEGYLSQGGATFTTSPDLSAKNRSDRNAAFFIGEIRPDGAIPCPDIPEFPAFRPAVIALYRAFLTLSLALLPLYARALHLPAAAFAPAFRNPMTTLRLTHYPPARYQPDEYGIAPHVDSSFITLLAQNPVPGLQLRLRNGEWADAPSLPGTLLVNTGDMLRRWTNDRFIATPHRASNATAQDRYAIPFFFHPDPDYRMTCLPRCEMPERPEGYPPLTPAEYMAWFNRNNYRHMAGKSA